MNLSTIVIASLIALAVSFLSSAAMEWWLRRRDRKRVNALVKRFEATEPKRCPLPDVELVAGPQKEAIEQHNAQVARELHRETAYTRKLRAVR